MPEEDVAVACPAMKIRLTLIIALLLLLFINENASSETQRQAASIRIIGCYSDVREIRSVDESLIVGIGDIRIKKSGKQYVGTFSQLRNELGEGYPPVPLEGVRVGVSAHTVSFSVKLFYEDNTGTRERISKATGRFARRGLQLFWEDNSLPQRQRNPFMTRRNDCQ